MFDFGREKRLRTHYETLNLKTLHWLKEQYISDSTMDLEYGLDNTPSLEKAQWIEEEIQNRH